MRSFLACLLLTIAGVTAGAETPNNAVKERFKSENYSVAWETPAEFDSSGELEIGYGAGHGSTLRWLRIRPKDDGVEVLSIQLDLDRKVYRTKWRPDRAAVVTKLARMSSDAYAALLQKLAIVDAARLEPVKLDYGAFSSYDFWAFSRFAVKDKPLIELNYVGYASDNHEHEYAKARIATLLAREAVETLEFTDHTLRDADRQWVCAKFVRDWKMLGDPKDTWWVRERYIIVSGVVADSTVVPALRDIISVRGDPKDRCVYYAINAVTRLTKKDVREEPVENMDIDAIRPKVLELLKDVK